MVLFDVIYGVGRLFLWLGFYFRLYFNAYCLESMIIGDDHDLESFGGLKVFFGGLVNFF